MSDPVPSNSTTVNQRHILFSAPMVRALHCGIKTQTRRLVSLPKAAERHGISLSDIHRVSQTADSHYAHDGEDSWVLPCPYGKPGDRLWVKENFRLLAKMDGVSPNNTVDSTRWYEADGVPPVAFQKYGRIRPSIHMPRWASRLTVEIEAVRVERLQDISEEDSLAEGIIRQTITVGRERGHPDYDMFASRPGDHCEWEMTAKEAYRRLWRTIHGAESWEANPWVWVVTFRTFKIITPPTA